MTIRQIALKLSLPYEAVYSALDSVKKMPRMSKKDASRLETEGENIQCVQKSQQQIFIVREEKIMKFQRTKMSRLNGCIGCSKSACKWHGNSVRESDHYTKNKYGEMVPNSDTLYGCNTTPRREVQ